MMMEHPPGLTLFPAKNPRPGPDPGGGCSSRHQLPPSVVLSGGGVTHNNLGQVNLNDRAATTLYKPTGRIFIPSQNFVTNSFFRALVFLSISFLKKGNMVAGGSGLNRVANRATTEDEEEYFEPSI